MFRIIRNMTYLGPWTMCAGGVGRGGIGHQRSFKVFIQGHVTKKGDLTKNFDQVCVWYDWMGHIPESQWSMDAGGSAVVK